MRQDAVVGILRGILRYTDETDASSPTLLRAAHRRQDAILFPRAFFRPFQGDFVIAGEGLHLVVVVGALAERLPACHSNAEDLTDEIDHPFRPGRAAQGAMDDDVVKAVVHKREQAAEQAGPRRGIVADCRSDLGGEFPQ
jgi:hypothetical protein